MIVRGEAWLFRGTVLFGLSLPLFLNILAKGNLHGFTHALPVTRFTRLYLLSASIRPRPRRYMPIALSN